VSRPPLPQHCPTQRELDDLELLTSGAADPIRGYNEPGSPLTLSLPDDLLTHLDEGHEVELVDPEGLPLARVSSALRGLAVTPLTHAQFGAFRRLHLTPAAVRQQMGICGTSVMLLRHAHTARKRHAGQQKAQHRPRSA